VPKICLIDDMRKHNPITENIVEQWPIRQYDYIYFWFFSHTVLEDVIVSDMLGRFTADYALLTAYALWLFKRQI